MKIEILGSGCPKCDKLKKLSEDILKEINAKATVEKITDLNEISKRGVFLTPALFINGSKKSEGKIPDKETIKEWIEGELK
jgi:small redox-active disulfide protein 2